MENKNLNLNEEKCESQSKRIINHLLQGKKITSLQALQWFDCLRLQARISELRNRGYKIQTEMVIVNSGKKVAQYYIATADIEECKIINQLKNKNK